ncbi:MAG: O-antigen ligase family protein [Verrucomicrobiota bacterium]
MHIFLAALLIACLVLIQCLAGGTRLVLALPPYAFAAAAAVLSLGWIRRPSVKPSTACLVSTLLLAGYTFWHAWNSPVPYLARPDAFMIGAALLVYLLTALYLTAPNARLWIVAALLAVAAVHVSVGLIQFREQNGFMLFGFLRGNNDWRASGMLICGNHLAGYLESVALLALGITLWSRVGVGLKMLTGYLTLFCYLGVLISGSRGGVLSWLISLAVFGLLCIWIASIYTPRNFIMFMTGTLVAGLVFLGVFGLVANNSSVIKSRLKKIESASTDGRIYNWQATLDQYRQNPVWGTGAGTHLYYGRLFRRPQLQADPVHSHGDYLELLAEYGIVGELLAVVFLLTHLFNGLHAIRDITQRRLCNALASARSDSLALTLGATAAVVALMAHSVVDFNMHIPGNALLFAFLFGMLGNPGTARPEPTRWLSSTSLLRVILAVLGIVMLAGVARRYKGEELTEKARVSLRNLQYQTSVEQATQAIQADPSNFYPHLYMGEAYRMIAFRMQIPPLRIAYFEKAATAFQKGLDQFPYDDNLMLKLGLALDGAHRFNEAEVAYLNAIRWNPNFGYNYALYAAHLELIGQLEASKKCREAARHLGTPNADEVGRGEMLILRSSTPPSPGKK